MFNKARRDSNKPSWVLLEDWAKLLVNWKYDPRFKQMSEIGKKAKSSTKGGSSHTSGAQCQGSVRRKLVCIIFLYVYIFYVLIFNYS